jgi:cytochrome oxidase Cu insertion factor (SCO1/SenC/PrrC family)
MKWRLIFFSAVLVLIGITVVFLTKGLNTKPPEVFGEVPPFDLTERSGKALGLNDLTGKIWIASFVFTHCGEQCPMVNAQMVKLQKRFLHRDRLKLVTITVDPDRDSVQALSEYAKKLGAVDDKWFFLTGKKNKVEELVEKGFKLSAGSSEEKGSSSMTHSLNLVLVDGSHRIRGYYDGMDSDAMRSLISDAKRLLTDKQSE